MILHPEKFSPSPNKNLPSPIKQNLGGGHRYTIDPQRSAIANQASLGRNGE